jgi:hypothetical protein
VETGEGELEPGEVDDESGAVATDAGVKVGVAPCNGLDRGEDALLGEEGDAAELLPSPAEPSACGGDPAEAGCCDSRCSPLQGCSGPMPDVAAGRGVDEGEFMRNVEWNPKRKV